MDSDQCDVAVVSTTLDTVLLFVCISQDKGNVQLLSVKSCFICLFTAATLNIIIISAG